MKLKLTSEQSKPVNSNCKINVVLSVPGSGKTTLLVARAQRLWEELQEQILIVTFSNEATEAISKKIDPKIRAHVTIKTIHSFCFDIVKRYWKELGTVVGGQDWPMEPKLTDKELDISLIQDFYSKENAVEMYDKFVYLKELNTPTEYLIGMFKKGVYFDKIRLSDIEKYASFIKHRHSIGVIDFDDMIGLAEILLSLPQVVIDLTRKYAHLLIDEAQDTSDLQWKIMRPLVLNSVSTLVVGDFNQALYAFRQADGSVLTNAVMMRDSVTFRLTKSFRTGGLISKLANQLVFDKSSQIISENHMDKVQLFRFDSPEEEVEWVLKNSDSETAILSRTNSYLERFERKCIELKKNYSGKSFFRANHVLSLAKFIQPYDEGLLAILEKAYISNSSYTKGEIEDFKSIYNIIKTSGKEDFLKLVAEAQDLDKPGLVLTTGHAAKGLEWDNVIIVGCHPGQIPHRNSNDDREERNILYVMTTRARKDLKITCVGAPSIYLPKELVS